MARAKAIEVKQVQQWQVVDGNDSYTIDVSGQWVQVESPDGRISIRQGHVNAVVAAISKAAEYCEKPKRIRKSRAKDTPLTDKNIKTLVESVKRLSPGMDKLKADIAEANAAMPRDAPHQTTLDEQVAAVQDKFDDFVPSHVGTVSEVLERHDDGTATVKVDINA